MIRRAPFARGASAAIAVLNGAQYCVDTYMHRYGVSRGQAKRDIAALRRLLPLERRAERRDGPGGARATYAIKRRPTGEAP